MERIEMNNKEVLGRISKIVSEIVNENIEVDETMLLKDVEEGKLSLGLSSLDMMDLIIQVEMEFDVEIEQERFNELFSMGNLVQMIIELTEKNSNNNNTLKEIEKELFE